MKSLVAIVLTLCLIGCSADDDLAPALRLRQQLQNCDHCVFTARVTADYGDRINTFVLQCEGDSLGNVNFTVCEPESISGITGKCSADGGILTFDDTVLAFPMLADGQITPVSAPYLLHKTLLGGYIHGCGQDGQYTKLLINDSYEDSALQLDIWLDDLERPVRADFLYKGIRFMTIDVTDFVVL